MKVLILSQYYDPEPVPKAAELAVALLQRGHDVEVITGFPNYPTGELYDGYRLAAVRRETIEGVRVLRAFEYPYHGRSVLKRLINFWSFAFSAPLAGLFTKRADVMYVWHPPLTVGVAAFLISWLRGIPFVYDVQDIWPESAVLSGMLRPGLMVRLMSRLEIFVYRCASHILVVTEGARQNLIGKGVPAGKVTAMRHWIDESMFAPQAEEHRVETRRRLGWSGFVVVFAGNIGMVQGLETVIRAAQGIDDGEPISFVIVGDGADCERLRALTSTLGVDASVKFIGRQPATQMSQFFQAADALLVHLKPSELSRYVIPTKTLAYLAAGKPIIMAMEGAGADLIRDSGSGVVLPPGDAALLLENVRELARMPDADRCAMGEAGRVFLAREFSRTKVIPQYEEILLRTADQ